MSYFTKTISVLLFCLILVGQSMASSVMVYNMVSMNMNENMMMDHSEMSMEAMNDDTKQSTGNGDCCAQKCQCFASGCSTASLFLKTVSLPLFMGIPTKIVSTSQFMPTQALTSLYRPPILS